jgi:hypothetical protein
MFSVGAKRTLFSVLCALFGLALILVSSAIVPAFTEDIARPVNVSTGTLYLLHYSFMLLWIYLNLWYPNILS